MGEFFQRANKQRNLQTVMVMLGTLRKGFMCSVVRLGGKESKKADVYLLILKLICEQTNLLREFGKEGVTNKLFSSPERIFEDVPFSRKVIHFDFGNSIQEDLALESAIQEIVSSENHLRSKPH